MVTILSTTRQLTNKLGPTKYIDCRLSSPLFQYIKQVRHYSIFIVHFGSLKCATPLNKRVWHPACEGQRSHVDNRFAKIATNLVGFASFYCGKTNVFGIYSVKM